MPRTSIPSCITNLIENYLHEKSDTHRRRINMIYCLLTLIVCAVPMNLLVSEGCCLYKKWRLIPPDYQRVSADPHTDSSHFAVDSAIIWRNELSPDNSWQGILFAGSIYTGAGWMILPSVIRLKTRRSYVLLLLLRILLREERLLLLSKENWLTD